MSFYFFHGNSLDKLSEAVLLGGIISDNLNYNISKKLKLFFSAKSSIVLTRKQKRVTKLIICLCKGICGILPYYPVIYLLYELCMLRIIQNCLNLIYLKVTYLCYTNLTRY